MTLANRVIGSVLLLFSVLVWVMSNTFPESTGPVPGADFFPKLTAVLLGALSILLVLRKEEGEGSVFSLSRKKSWSFVAGFGAMILYVLLIEPIGFSTTTILFLFAWMWLMGIRKWVTLIVASILISIGVTFVFELLLNVPIPHGILY